MIPKIVHYCWFGKQKKSASILKYINIWHEKLPDYVFKEWREDNFDYSKYQYAKDAYNLGKYAFVSDICRLVVLFKYGGIYLDTDIEIIGNFDLFLNYKSFIGYERANVIGTGVIGSEPGEKWIYDFLSIYETVSFPNKRNAHVEANTVLLTRFLQKYDRFKRPIIFPYDYFCAKDWKTGNITITKNTVCIHHYIGTWVQTPSYEIWESKFWKLFGLKNLNILNKIIWRLKIK